MRPRLGARRRRIHPYYVWVSGAAALILATMVLFGFGAMLAYVILLCPLVQVQFLTADFVDHYGLKRSSAERRQVGARGGAAFLGSTCRAAARVPPEGSASGRPRSARCRDRRRRGRARADPALADAGDGGGGADAAAVAPDDGPRGSRPSKRRGSGLVDADGKKSWPDGRPPPGPATAPHEGRGTIMSGRFSRAFAAIVALAAALPALAETPLTGGAVRCAVERSDAVLQHRRAGIRGRAIPALPPGAVGLYPGGVHGLLLV